MFTEREYFTTDSHIISSRVKGDSGARIEFHTNCSAVGKHKGELNMNILLHLRDNCIGSLTDIDKDTVEKLQHWLQYVLTIWEEKNL